MKKILLLAIIILNCLVVSAQHIKVEKQKSQLYITHKVKAKETLYSLGRMYHLSPKEIATANKLKADAGLKLGDHIKIPLNKSNFVQTPVKRKADLEPVYHTVKKGENLFKISKNFNKVKEADLKKWNKLSKSIIKPGEDLIIGYVKMNDNTKEETTASSKATAKTDTAKTIAFNQKDQQENKPAKPVYDVAPTNNATDITITKANPSKTEDENPSATFINAEGYFTPYYSVNAGTTEEKKINGTAATFKSTSGWSDKKYYMLTNNVVPETIVKIITNGKYVFAKVLGTLPDLKDNKGISFRISNAAASALGITDAKFDVEVNFYE